MKKMLNLRYVAFFIAITTTTQFLHASGRLSGSSTPTSGMTDVESRDSDVINAFEIAGNNLVSLPLDVAAKKAALEYRIQKVSYGARTNVEMDDEAIQEFYGPIEALSLSIDKLEHVGASREVIERLKERLLAILEALPDVSRLSSVGEDNPSLQVSVDNHSLVEYINRTVGASISDDAPFSRFAEAVQRFFNDEARKAEVAQFVTNLMTVYSSSAKENSIRVYGNENFNKRRLFCYRIARAAGYDADNLITNLLKEMKDCIEGSGHIVQVFNNILINDVRPLLLEVKLLENADVLNGYLEALNSLAHHTRKGVAGVYTAYGEADGIYTELQRVYSSLQIHVMRLRIETRILPALEAELGNKEAQLKALEEQRRLREEQDAKRLNAMTPEARLRALSLNLNGFIEEKMRELEGIAAVQRGVVDSTVLDGLVDKAKVGFTEVKTRFEESIRDLTSASVEVMERYRLNRIQIVQIFDHAKKAIENPIRDRAEAVRRVDEAREEALSRMSQVNTTTFNPKSEAERLAQLEAIEAERLRRIEKKDVEAERNWRSESSSRVSAAGEAELAAKAQDAHVATIVNAIKNKPDLSKALQRPRLVNQILDDRAVETAINALSPERYVDVRSQVTAAHVMVDESKINKVDLYNKLKQIVSE